MGERKYLVNGLKKFVRELNKDFSIRKIILFGSRATNKFRSDSDRDLIIVSSDFEGLNFFKRCAKMYDYWELDLPVDFLCYTPEEFNKLKRQISIVKEAVENDIEI